MSIQTQARGRIEFYESQTYIETYTMHILSLSDNRTEPNLVDLSQAFTDLGVSLPELAGFMSQVRSTPLEHKVPLYPVQQSSTHIHNGEQSGRCCRYTCT